MLSTTRRSSHAPRPESAVPPLAPVATSGSRHARALTISRTNGRPWRWWNAQRSAKSDSLCAACAMTASPSPHSAVPAMSSRPSLATNAARRRRDASRHDHGERDGVDDGTERACVRRSTGAKCRHQTVHDEAPQVGRGANRHDPDHRRSSGVSRCTVNTSTSIIGCRCSTNDARKTSHGSTTTAAPAAPTPPRATTLGPGDATRATHATTATGTTIIGVRVR